MAQATSRRRNGFTLVELAATGAALAAASSAFLCVAAAHRGDGHTARDATQAAHLHRATLMWSAQRGDTALATPSLIRRAATPRGYFAELGAEQISYNTTASLNSALIAEQFLDVDDLVSPVDTNPVVRPMLQYNFLSYSPTAIVPTFWDPNFLANIHRLADGAATAVSHTSYAHLALTAKRRELHWRSTAGAATALFANRGTFRGATSGTNYSLSYSLLFHPPYDAWTGHVVYGDNHVSLESTFSPGAGTPCSGGKNADNIFARDCTLPNSSIDGEDIWICFAIGSTTASSYTEAPERLTNGSAPQ